MPYPVKNYRSDDVGLSKISAAVGSFVGLLEACLVTGFNLRTLDSLTYDSATDLFVGTVGSGHGYRLNQIVVVGGASPSQFNCEIWITAITATTFTGKAHISDARPASAAASGTMTVKAAPQGSWSKPYASADGTKAVFRMESPDSSKCCLRVDNSIACSASYGMYCLVDGYEIMSGLDTGINQFGYYSAGANHWGLRARTTYSDSPWMLFADGAAFWGFYKIVNSSSATDLPIDDLNTRYLWRSFFFGDMVKRNSSDAYPCLLASGAYTLSGSQDQYTLVSNTRLLDLSGSSSQGISMARDMYGSVGKRSPYGQCSTWPSMNYSGVGPLTFPSPVDNSLMVIPNGIYIMETNKAIRGNVPGYWVTPQDVRDVIGPAAVFEGFPGAEGRKFTSVHAQYLYGSPAPNSSYGTLGFIDITGPWR